MVHAKILAGIQGGAQQISGPLGLILSFANASGAATPWSLTVNRSSELRVLIMSE
jgi:hypothetical protein